MKSKFLTTLKIYLPMAACTCLALLGSQNAQAQAPVVLLGEVHDNQIQHAMRAAVFKALLETGLRPALLMEQFDREDQPKIDRVIANAASAGLPATIAATQIIAAVADAKGVSGSWSWPFYRPFLILALDYKLPIIAANVSRADTRLIYSQGLGANGFNEQVPEDIQGMQTRAIHESHCGMINMEQAGKMAASQVARDQWMAQQIDLHSRQGVVLLAGNGHVRKDIGVPRWLSEPSRQQTQAIGYLERDTAPTAAESKTDSAQFDVVRYTATQQREDPCAKFRKPVNK